MKADGERVVACTSPRARAVYKRARAVCTCVGESVELSSATSGVTAPAATISSRQTDPPAALVLRECAACGTKMHAKLPAAYYCCIPRQRLR